MRRETIEDSRAANAGAATLSDECLIAAIAGGNEDIPLTADAAFVELYERHSRAVFAIAVTHAGPSDAPDIVQTVWQRVWKSLPEKASKLVQFRAWILEITRNCAIDHLRKNRHRLHPIDSEPADTRGAAALQQALLEERRAVLSSCLSKLDDVSVQLIRARLGGSRYEQICDRLGLEAQQAYKIVHKATERLRQCARRQLP